MALEQDASMPYTQYKPESRPKPDSTTLRKSQTLRRRWWPSSRILDYCFSRTIFQNLSESDLSIPGADLPIVPQNNDTGYSAPLACELMRSHIGGYQLEDQKVS